MLIDLKTLTKISSISFLLSFLILFMSTYFFEPKIVPISSITYLDVNKAIGISAEIIKKTQIHNNLFLKIKDNSSEVSAVFFNTNSSSGLLKLKLNENYLFYGRITNYKGELELSIEKIKINLN